MSGTNRHDKTDTQQSIVAEWEKEINRRVAELDAGLVKTVSWNDVRRRVLERLKVGETRVANLNTRKLGGET